MTSEKPMLLLFQLMYNTLVSKVIWLRYYLVICLLNMRTHIPSSSPPWIHKSKLVYSVLTT
jgi:hypothetical protein